MSATLYLRAGSPAPSIAAQDYATRKTNSLDERLSSSGASIFIYWIKSECPTCRLALPFIARIARVAPQRVFVVMQDDRTAIASVVQAYGLLPDVIASEEAPYTSADAYGITNVPTWFEVARDDGGKPVVKDSGMAFVQKDLEGHFAAVGGGASLFSEEERARLPVLQPG
ncbi:MAG TPA: hypothetical protein PKE00_07490 [Planctomycetota bacterium]|nr:hypothetical protein [Planctomycetota bacterium]